MGEAGRSQDLLGSSVDTPLDSARDRRYFSSQEDDWNIAEAFRATLDRARDEGVDVFAKAKMPSFRQSARKGHAPKLKAPHIKGSGVTCYLEADIARLDICLTRDYFLRPAWNKSTLPVCEAPEVGRISLEAIAREARVEVVRDLLRREEDAQPSTRESILTCCRARGYTPAPTPRRDSDTCSSGVGGASLQRPNTVPSGFRSARGGGQRTLQPPASPQPPRSSSACGPARPSSRARAAGGSPMNAVRPMRHRSLA